MSTILLKYEAPLFDPEEDDAMARHPEQRRFLEGECYAFAIAVSRNLGWPIVGLINPLPGRGEEILHAGTLTPDNRLFDVRGFLTEDEFGSYFMSSPFNLRQVTEVELRAVRPIHEEVIQQAKKLAELLWPELPWRSRELDRYKAFVDELEALSRKHRLWITSPLVTTQPSLNEGYDDEAGYSLQPTVFGYTIDRCLPSQLERYQEGGKIIE